MKRQRFHKLLSFLLAVLIAVSSWFSALPQTVYAATDVQDDGTSSGTSTGDLTQDKEEDSSQNQNASTDDDADMASETEVEAEEDETDTDMFVSNSLSSGQDPDTDDEEEEVGCVEYRIGEGGSVTVQFYYDGDCYDMGVFTSSDMSEDYALEAYYPVGCDIAFVSAADSGYTVESAIVTDEDGTVLESYTGTDAESIVVQASAAYKTIVTINFAEGESNAPYANYAYGDPVYSYNDVYGYDEDGNEVPQIYVDDLDEIIALAEDGMSLSDFFKGTVFSAFTLDILYLVKDSGISLDTVVLRYLNDGTLDKSILIALNAAMAAMLMTSDTIDSMLIANGCMQISTSKLGQIDALGSSKSHGVMLKLRAKGATTGTTTYAFCASYGNTYRRGYQYTAVDSPVGILTTPSGDTLTQEQYDAIVTIINIYEKTSACKDFDYSVAQLVIWYVINNGAEFNADTAWENGLSTAAEALGHELAIYNALRSYEHYIGLGSDSISNTSPMDNHPDCVADVTFWSSSVSNSQWIITWTIDENTEAPTDEELQVPSFDNFYEEVTATTNYLVELTKTSVITNELLSDIQLLVVENTDNGASGYTLNYDIYTGTNASYGTDYINAGTSTFGTLQLVADTVPYMDNAKVSDGSMAGQTSHSTVLTTDENGYASTTFTHTHTFREYYSVCYNGNGDKIDYATYKQMWKSLLDTIDGLLEQGDGLGSADDDFEVIYQGSTVTMTYDEIMAIYAEQQAAYTQTIDDAEDTLCEMYEDYVSRTYNYTVTELTTATRAETTDWLGNVLSELDLPKLGYRMNIQDVTTMGAYNLVVADAYTMTVGGTNDEDDNTTVDVITNEPWYNQIFINKTDLESGSQILYDTEFEIYEYYSYVATVKAADKTIYPALLLKQYINEYGSGFNTEMIKSLTLKVIDGNGEEQYATSLDVQTYVEALDESKEDTSIDVSLDKAGTYTVLLEVEIDTSLASDVETTIITNGELKAAESCICESVDECKEDCPVCSLLSSLCADGWSVSALWNTAERQVVVTFNEDGSMTTSDGGTITYTFNSGYYYYTYTKADGTVLTLNNVDNNAYIDPAMGARTIDYFCYTATEDTGIRVLTKEGEESIVTDGSRVYISMTTDDDDESLYTLTYAFNTEMFSGTYTYESEVIVTGSEIVIDSKTSSDADKDDYTTWGQDNYEIVRVTAEIAQAMGWDDSTIGMYTVHRLYATDAYTGTTFSNNTDTGNGQEYGYAEYGTLYYTQANEGKFAIVEKTAPSDGTNNGYLGNYSDRDYSELDETSSAKNTDGDPYDTDDSVSTVKMVHYIDLCTDTNQYATYMLTDGYVDYSSEKYTTYVETLDDPAQTATEDGYDAIYYKQSALSPTIGLETASLDANATILGDVLNAYRENILNELIKSEGVTINRDSEKTSTYFALYQLTNVVANYVSTTINRNSYVSSDAADSDMSYSGTYTDTTLNYNSYAGEDAEALNARDGFNGREFLQTVSSITYDNSTEEKAVRYNATTGTPVVTVVDDDQTYAFIDERNYGFLRLTKYDTEAERYVDGDLSDAYEAGTDHGDADLDGAIYSLYVDESNSFTVTYYEGTYNGTLFWAMPLTSGGFRIIWDGDSDASSFTDKGTNDYTDDLSAYLFDGDEDLIALDTDNLKLSSNFGTEEEASVSVKLATAIYYGIQHPDGMYGGEKHNGFFAVMEEQQVFIDTDLDGFGDTWTLQDVTLENGAKVASAVISDGELEMTGLYLGNYYAVEEIRTSVVITSYDNDDEESREVRWLSFATGYTAETDASGNPVKHYYSFVYQAETIDDTDYAAEQVYVIKDTSEVTNQQVIKGAGFQIHKESTYESSSSTVMENTNLEGAGFTVYLISELSKITDGTIQPVYSRDEGILLINNGDLVVLYDSTGNMVGYKYSDDYLSTTNPFTEKYGTNYDEDEVNQLIYVADYGYYYLQDILDAYINTTYSNESEKWDFSAETAAIARMYEDDASVVEAINAKYTYVENNLANGGTASCEWYGVNGISEGWVSTGVKNEYVLSELFTNHFGNIKSPELPWGAYIVVETTTPEDKLTADPMFVTITDSSATINRSGKVNISDASFTASLVLVKRDAQSGQNVLQSGTTYRIWDYTNEKYVSTYMYGPNGEMSMVEQNVFTTDESGRLNAVACLAAGDYRIEELVATEGYYNLYWDHGNTTDGETLGGVGTDAERAVADNAYLAYYGSVDFTVTTDRLYKSSGITAYGNSDYICIGETYYNDEVVGKITILKTGEVLVGYTNTDDIEYADEYTDVNDDDFNYTKASAKDRAVFEEMKDYYDLGRDLETTVEITTTLSDVVITEVSYILTDVNGMRIAAVYTAEDGTLYTMSGGEVAVSGEYITVTYELTEESYEGAMLAEATDMYIYAVSGTTVNTSYLVTDSNGTLVTNDGGLITANTDGSYTLTYLSTLYDTDINYDYVLTMGDGTTYNVHLVTYGVYLTEDGDIVTVLSAGGYSITDIAGNVAEDADATISLEEDNTGTTYDFVYEERALAGATYQIIAAEDIATQDGGTGNYWFKAGDVVATVTTGADGEIVSFSPNYNTDGTYEYTYYYGNSEGTYTSLSGTKSYTASEFATTGSISNYWTESNMSAQDTAIYGTPSFTDETIYANTFYKEGSTTIYRRIYRAGATKSAVVTDYVTRLENEGTLTSSTTGIVTQTSSGYRLSYTCVKDYTGASLVENGDTYLLNLSDGNSIQVELSTTKYRITETDSNTWATGDIVEKTAGGYLITHTTDSEAGVEIEASNTDCAKDLGYTYRQTFASATIKDNGDGTYSLYAAGSEDAICTMTADVYLTEDGGYLVDNGGGSYTITYDIYTDYSDNAYVDATLEVQKAYLTIQTDTYILYWDSANQRFETVNGTTVVLSDDCSYVTVTMGSTVKNYYTFDLEIEYELSYAEEENIVTVENDGTLGTVSIYLPLGTYEIKEIATPYGFLISETTQTVTLEYADQIKEIVFNSNTESVADTAETMRILESKGLSWYIGGENTLGEHLVNLLNTNFWTWGTYGDAEVSYYTDEQAFIAFYDQRIKAWSTSEEPASPDSIDSTDDTADTDDTDDTNNDRHAESEENQWNLGVGIYKTDTETGEGLGGAKFGLYTTDDIYNVDGKLIVEKDTLLATATTDDSGFANFAVDIALMSKYLDEAASDATLIYTKTVVYSYSSFTALADGSYLLTADGCDDLYLTYVDGNYVTDGGQTVTVDTEDCTVTYNVEVSIDGNTSVNTGKFYIKELTPPKGYLIDDTIYDVEFTYADEYTMYIPVYAEHSNETTEVTLTKYELTGQEEVEGATIAIYKVKDVNCVDEDGLISHSDDNLELLETWVSTTEEHTVTGLYLSNTEWASLNNQEVKDNIYVFRELIPADGYVSATDIEFKLLQISDEDGNWGEVSADGKGYDSLYGYEVLVRLITCDQSYLSGTIIAAADNADDWILNGEEENNWDYAETLAAITVAQWLLVNEHLMIFISDGATENTIAKTLQERDFADLAFSDVYFEFAGTAFTVDFYSDLVIEERAEDSYLTYTQLWTTLDDVNLSIYDDVTKISISKQDIVTGEEVVGATLRVIDAETGTVIDTWITEADAETGEVLPHEIIGELVVGRTYILEETLAPTEDGYVTSNSVEFVVSDTGEIQSVVMEDDFTKLEISKIDSVTGDEISGADLELWTVNANGEKETLIASWTTGDDGYTEDGSVNPHYIDYLSPGSYVLVETNPPEGYTLVADIYFTLEETGTLQTVVMEDAPYALVVYKYQTGTITDVAGAQFAIYSLPEEYLTDESTFDESVTEIVVSDSDLVKVFTTENAPTKLVDLTDGWYVIVETCAPNGYLLDETPQVIYFDTSLGLMSVTFYNDLIPSTSSTSQPKESESKTVTEEVVVESTPSIGVLRLSINAGGFWNNIRTEDNGEPGSSITLTVVHENSASDVLVKMATVYWPQMLVGAILVGFGGAGLYFMHKKRRRA